MSRNEKDNKRTLRQDIAEYWTNRAEGYSLVNQEELAGTVGGDWAGEIGRRIRQKFPALPEKEISVLDIGTGPGFFAILLAGAGYSVTAVDYSDAMLEQARKNAGDLADVITFRQMDAEALDFPEESFDIILSRNLTWNLEHPEKAYASWLRTLKKGGLLLNFDANWYTWMNDEEMQKTRAEERRIVEENGIRNFETDPGINEDAMTSIVRRIPLTFRQRPDWDIQTLKNLGLTDAEISVDTEIWRTVWSESEKQNYARTTPMFLVEVHKNPDSVSGTHR